MSTKVSNEKKITTDEAEAAIEQFVESREPLQSVLHEFPLHKLKDLWRYLQRQFPQEWKNQEETRDLHPQHAWEE